MNCWISLIWVSLIACTFQPCIKKESCESRKLPTETRKKTNGWITAYRLFLKLIFEGVLLIDLNCLQILPKKVPGIDRDVVPNKVT